MTQVNFNLRGIPSEMMTLLKEEAGKQDKSVNSFILTLIRQKIGYLPNKRMVYHDLDQLAGTWSAQDLHEFKENSTLFELIDEELWR